MPISDEKIERFADYVAATLKRDGGQMAVFVLFQSVTACRPGDKEYRRLENDPAFDNCLAGLFTDSGTKQAIAKSIADAMKETRTAVELAINEADKAVRRYQKKAKR